jgi:hypothetical protein
MFMAPVDVWGTLPVKVNIPGEVPGLMLPALEKVAFETLIVPVP